MMVGSDELLLLHDRVAGLLCDSVGSESLLAYISGSLGREKVSELLEMFSSGKAILDFTPSSPLVL